MKKQVNRNLLIKSIREAETASCTLHIEGLEPNTFVVRSSTINEHGKLCFQVTCKFPGYLHHALDDFHASLTYYKKGLGYSLLVETAANSTETVLTGDLTTLCIEATISAAYYKTATGVVSTSQNGSVFGTIKNWFSRTTALYF